MKKLMTVMASAATALFAIGAVNGDEQPLNATSFEDLDLNTQLNTLAGDDGQTTADKYYWYMASTDADNGTLVTNGVAGSGVSRPDFFAQTTNEKALSLDTSSPLFRHMGSTSSGSLPSTGEEIGDGIYLDTLVKFTAADDVFGEDALQQGVDKIAISYVEREEETADGAVTVPALTNFVIRAGGIVDGEFGAVNYIAAVPAGFKKDAWHRLTVRAIADVGDGQAGFIVYLDGDMEKALAYDTNVDAGFTAVTGTYAEKYYNNNIHAIYPSAVNVGDNKAKISAVSFSGTGAIDDVVFTKAKPSFIVESPKVTFTWDEDVTELTIGETTLTADQLAAKSLIVDLVGTTISVEATVASGKAARYATTGERASWDATNGQFTGLVAGDSCSISAIVPAFEVGGIPYTTDEITTVLDLAEAGTQASPVTVKLVANCNQLISLGEGEYNPEDAAYVVLDLNGHDIQGGELDDYSVINNGVNLTIINSGSAASVKVPTYEQASGVLLAGLGFTTIEAGTYEGTVIAIPDDEEEGTVSTMLIKGGSFLDAAYVDEPVFYLAGFVQSGLAVTYDSATQYVQVGGGTPQPTTYALTLPDVKVADVTAANATVKADGVAVDDITAIAAGTVVTVEWTAVEGYKITAGETETITMDAAKTAAAPTVVAITYATLTITPVNNCTIVVSNATAEVASGAKFDVDDKVALTVYRTPAEGFKLAADCLAEETITMDQDRAVTASVEQDGEKTYPSYIGEDTNKKAKYNEWATYAEISSSDFPDSEGTNKDAYLLNCKPSEVEAAKAAFKFTGISYDATEEKWVTTTTTGYNEREYNGTVTVKQYSDVGCTTESETGTFFKAVLQ